MKFYLALFCIVLVVQACTGSKRDKNKNSTDNATKTSMKKAKSTIIEIDSPYTFRYEPEKLKDDVVAQIGEIQVTQPELAQNSPAIKEITNKNKEQIILVAYRLALPDASKEKKSIVKLSFQKPKKSIKDILKSFQIEDKKLVDFQFSEEEQSSLVAEVNGRSYSEEDLSKGSVLYSKNLQSLFQLKIRRLEDLISRKILLKQAEEKQMPLKHYIMKHVFADNQVTDEQAKQYAVENNIPEDSITKDMLARLKSILKAKGQTKGMHDHAAGLVKGKKVWISFASPVIKIQKLDIPEGVAQKGSGGHEIVVMSNFMCPQCRSMEPKLDDIVEKNSSKVKFSYLFSFSKEKRRARMVAEAALCVKAQKEDDFWKFRKTALDENFDGQEQSINAVVKALSLDYQAFRKCFLARNHQKEIDAQLSLTKGFGYLKLPIVIVDGQYFESPLSVEKINEMIQ